NIEAFNAHRQLVGTSDKLSAAMERLSSGYRINRASDDAAGLAISEKLRAEIGGLDQAQRNTQDAVSMVQTAEGAMAEVHSMLQRVRELAVEYNNGTLSATDKASIDQAVQGVADARGQFGSIQNRLEHTLASLATFQENLTASESRIRDVDMASEMVNFTKLQILQQAGTSMLAQANQLPQSVLTLLR